MKNLLLVITLFGTLNTFSQNSAFEKNEIDDMLGHKVLITKWSTIVMNWNSTVYSRIHLSGENIFLDIKAGTNKVTSAQKDALLILKTWNDSLIKLKNSSYTISGIGDGAIGLSGSRDQGISLSYQISKKELEEISKNGIKKIRIYLSDYYMEEELKKKKSDSFKKLSIAFLIELNN